MKLPVHQVCKGQPRPAELLIQPDAEIAQRLAAWVGVAPVVSWEPTVLTSYGGHRL